MGLPSALTGVYQGLLLFFLLACDTLVNYRVQTVRATVGLMDQVASLIALTMNAGTPLLLAALGIVINERSGVVNLGTEGMMLVAAVVGFAMTLNTGQYWLGFIAGAVAGIVLALLFAVLAVGLLTNQFATGLALSLFGAGLSAFIGLSLQGSSLPPRGADGLPMLRDIPFIGPALFAQHWLVYLSLGLTAAVAWFLFRTRRRFDPARRGRISGVRRMHWVIR